MGNASYLEDIQKRFDDSQRYFEDGIANLRSGLLRNRPSVDDIQKIREQIDRFIDDLETRTLAVFTEARKRLSDPGVRLVNRLEKKERELADTKYKASQVDQAHQAFARLQREFNALAKERDSLTSELLAAQQRISSLEVAKKERDVWDSATSGVKKIRK